MLAGLGWSELHAQSMYVKENDGTQTAYSLSNIRKLSFSSASLTITESSNNNVVYALSELRYLSFSDSTAVNVGPEFIAEHVIRMYPNPVHNELKIDLSDAVQPAGTLSIISLEGRLLKTEQISGPGILSLDMSHLPGGTYICSFSNGTENKAVKIIKQ
jgi:hypothetical protein